METRAITLHAVKTLSIGGIVVVIVIAAIVVALIPTILARVVAVVVALVIVIALWTQVHEVDYRYRFCDDRQMSFAGIHYRVQPHCARS
jgi:uncharacterized membrane protein